MGILLVEEFEGQWRRLLEGDTEPSRALTLEIFRVTAADALDAAAVAVVGGERACAEVLGRLASRGDVRVLAAVTDPDVDPARLYDLGAWDCVELPDRAHALPSRVRHLSRAALSAGRDARYVTRLEDALVRARRLEALGLVAGGIAHDFSNLLTVITSGARLVLDAPELSGDARDDARQVLEASERAGELTRQLFSVVRRPSREQSSVEVSAALCAMEPILRRVTGRDLTLTLRLADALPHARVTHAHLEQVLLDLVVNAREALRGRGAVEVSTRLEARPELDGGTCVAVQVRDDGEGMDEATLARAFDPFFTTRAGEGRGLGLTTARALVARHGGAVVASSVRGAGSTFTVLLPLAHATPTARPPAGFGDVARHGG